MRIAINSPDPAKHDVDMFCVEPSGKSVFYMLGHTQAMVQVCSSFMSYSVETWNIWKFSSSTNKCIVSIRASIQA